MLSNLILKTIGSLYEPGLLAEVVSGSFPFYLAKRGTPVDFASNMSKEARQHLREALIKKD